TYFLPRAVGTAAALEMRLTGSIIDADEALRIGLVSRVCDDVVTAALDVAAAIAAQPSHAVAMTRRNTYRALELGLEAEILEQEATSQAVALKGSEFPERFAAWRRRIQG